MKILASLALRRSFSMGICLLALSISGKSLAENSAPSWWNKDWKRRKTIRLVRRTVSPAVQPGSAAAAPDQSAAPANKPKPKPRFRRPADILAEFARKIEPLDTATVRFYGEGHIRPDGADIRVVDTSGNLLPFRIKPIDSHGYTVISFQAPPDSSEVFIYFDNPEAQAPAIKSDWVPHAQAVSRVTSRINIFPTTPEQAVWALERATVHMPREGLKSISFISWQGRLSLSDSYIYLSRYDAHFKATEEGEYEFALAGYTPAFLWIDDMLVAQTRMSGRHHRGTIRNWQKSGEVHLKAGLHLIRLLHVHKRRGAGLRLGWKPPNTREFLAIPPSAYVTSMDAFESSYETASGPFPVFFSVEEPKTAVDLGEQNFVVTAKLLNHCPESARPRTYEWDFGDGMKLHARSPTRSFQLDKEYRIRLSASEGAKQLGEYERPVVFSEVPTIEKLNLAVSLVSCPNVVYSQERANVAFRVKNEMNSQVRVSYLVHLSAAELPAESLSGALDVSAHQHSTVLIPLNMSGFPKGAGTLTLTMKVLQKTVFQQKIQFRRWEEGLAQVRNARGRFLNASGRRIVLVNDLEDPDKYRKWAPIKWIDRFADRSAKKVLVVGDPMLPRPEGSSFRNYFSFLRASVGQSEESLRFSPAEKSVAPAFDMLVAAPGIIEKSPADIVVLSPGLLDVLQATPLRDYVRALDVLIDMTRGQEEPGQAIIVGPPPLLSQPGRAEKYNEALKKLAAQHHCLFIDLHAALRENPGWQQAYYASSEDDRVFYLYPNEQGQRKIADLIAGEIH